VNVQVSDLTGLRIVELSSSVGVSHNYLCTYVSCAMHRRYNTLQMVGWRRCCCCCWW